jgi:hypothetical protein
MTVEQAVTVIALILGPMLAVGLSFFVQKRDFVRQQRMSILRTLLSMRAERLNPERIRALGLIDLVFYNKPAVRAKWSAYYESLNNPAYRTDPNAGNVWVTKENEMLVEMARAIGYGKAIGYEELQRTYAPQAFADNAALQQEAQKELIRVLKASEHMGEARKESQVSQLKPPASGQV